MVMKVGRRGSVWWREGLCGGEEREGVWNADHVKIRSSKIGCFHQSIMQLSAAFINRSCNYRLLSSIDHATIGCFHPFMPIKKCNQPIDDPSIETSIPSIDPSMPSIDAIDRSHRSMPSIGPIDRCHRSVPSIDAIDRSHRSMPSIGPIDRCHRSVPSIDAVQVPLMSYKC